MASRYTQTEKWNDEWFRNLTPNAKVLYWYVWDKCDIAGFWKIDFDGAAFATKIPIDDMADAFTKIKRGVILAKGYLWVRRYLYHQKNLPLNPDNPQHKGIIKKVAEYKPLFPDAVTLIEEQAATVKKRKKIDELVKPYGRKKKSGVFIPPTVEEVQAVIDERGYEMEAGKFHSFYESKGWLVGRGKMKDWRAALAQANYNGWAKKQKKMSEMGV